MFLVWCQSRRAAVTSPDPPARTARAGPPYPDSARTMPSADTTGDVYTSFPSPPHDQSSFPVAGSNPFTFSGTVRISSSRPPTLATTGVLHDPTQLELPAVPGFPPGS